MQFLLKNNFVVSSFQVILPLFQISLSINFFSHTIYIIPKIIPFSLLLFVLGYTANAASIIVIINNKSCKIENVFSIMKFNITF